MMYPMNHDEEMAFYRAKDDADTLYRAKMIEGDSARMHAVVSYLQKLKEAAKGGDSSFEKGYRKA
jgi:cytochrome c